jgi:hypothetical protein
MADHSATIDLPYAGPAATTKGPRLKRSLFDFPWLLWNEDLSDMHSLFDGAARIAAILFGTLATAPAAAQDYRFVDLNPPGFTSSRATGIDGGLIAGHASSGTSTHATAWSVSGGANSAVDLNGRLGGSTASDVQGGRIIGVGHGEGFPRSGSTIIWDEVGSNFRRLETVTSAGWGLSGNAVVGSRSSDGVSRATRWDATTGEFSDLNVVLNNGSYGGSLAYGVDGNIAVGFGGLQGINGFGTHAVAWDLSAGGFTDLHPDGYTHTWAKDVSGSLVVGYGELPTTGDNDRALLWNLATNSFTDLHNSEFLYSNAHDVSESAGLVVGSANVGNAVHAIAWDLTGGLYVDLHELVPAGYTQSEATAVDAFGNIVGSVTTADGVMHAALWRNNAAPTGDPPPPSVSLLSVSLNPTSVIGGAASLGTVSLDAPAPAGGAVVSLSSSHPYEVAAPTSVTVPAGATSANFGVATRPIPSAISVTITGWYGGATRSAVLTVQPAPSDSVAIQQAVYHKGKQELTIQATSSNPAAMLKAYATSTGALIGTLRNDGGGRYSASFRKVANPGSVTVVSDRGGSATKTVSVR